MITLRLVALSAGFVLAAGANALAQTALPPTPGPAPVVRPAPDAAGALRAAYRAIAEAEARGTSPLLDQAKSHYRNAVARNGRGDRGALAEAFAAAALARAAVAERPLTVPRDLPTPPPLAAAPRGPFGPQMGRPGPRPGGRGLDAAALAADAKLVNTPEAQDLARRALEAEVARMRAAFAGNPDEAQRQGRVAQSLSLAVRSLALADHPPALRRGVPGPPGGFRTRGPIGLAAPTDAEMDGMPSPVEPDAFAGLDDED